MTLYDGSTDLIGTDIGIDSEDCATTLSSYNSLNHLVPFATKISIISSDPIDFVAFTQQQVSTQSSTNLLEYLFESNEGYCTLNPIRHLEFIEALWGPEYLLPYYEYTIVVEDEIMFPGQTILAYSNYTKSDTISMIFTKVTDSNQNITCP